MNNGEYRLFATLRVDDKDDADRIEYVAFTNDDNCAYFAIRNERNGENGILNDTAVQFSVITA